jgi:5-formyltetrahydrofolate cyclo-ligase
MGGGYYDRALQRRRRKPVLVGAAFALQEVPAVPDLPWDVPLDLVVTERGRHKRGARA